MARRGNFDFSIKIWVRRAQSTRSSQTHVAAQAHTIFHICDMMQKESIGLKKRQQKKQSH
jgi:hypothetical protein